MDDVLTGADAMTGEPGASGHYVGASLRRGVIRAVLE